MKPLSSIRFFSLSIISSLLLTISLSFTLFVTSAQADGPLFEDSGQTLADNNTAAIALGDLDGDGDVDLFEVVSTGGACCGQASQVWFNNGEGGFANSGQALGVANSQAVALGDLDGDGDLDVYVGNALFEFGTNFDQVWLNDGQGMFTATSQEIGTSNSFAVALGDVDGDGDLDAVTANDGTNKVWLNNGFAFFTDSGQALDASPSRAIALADLDGDADLDLVSGNGTIFGGAADTVWFNNGSGLFSNSGQALETLQTTSLGLGDVDDDGDFDVVMGSTTSISLWRNNGGLFSDTGQRLGSGTANIQLGDIDGDDDLDIVAGNSGGNTVWLNNGSGTFADSGQTYGTSFTTDIALADLDNDSDLDFFAGNDGANRVWLQTGIGNFAESDQILGSQFSYAVALGDVDQNGTVDAFFANTTADSVWLNDGQGNFRDSGQTLGSSLSWDVALGDLNNDGWLDAVVAGSPNTLYRNDGSGLFSDSGQSFGTSRGLALGDLDGDEDLDLVLANDQANQVWFNNSGIFVDSGQRLGSTFTTKISLADLDGDGDLDIYNNDSRTLTVTPNHIWLNDGLGQFSPTPSMGLHSDANAFADLDGDGDLDAFLSWGLRRNDQVWLNQGDASFEQTAQYLGDTDSRDVALADLDGDGDIDAFIGNSATFSNTAFINNGAGLFTDSGLRLGNRFTQGIALADLDQDGDIDAIAANSAENRIFFNGQQGSRHLPNNPFALSVERPNLPPTIVTNTVIAIPFVLTDTEGGLVGRIDAFYSLNGGDNWQPAIPTTETPITALPTNAGQHLFHWDTFASGFFGQSDNVVIRMVAYPQPATAVLAGTYRYTNTVVGPVQRPYAAATSLPFRARGTQVRVVDDAGNPLPNALVYRLPNGNPGDGVALGQADETPYRTNRLGYLPGHGVLAQGDRLLAMTPLNLESTLTWATGLSDTIRIYQTNNRDETGVPHFTILNPGLQQVVVSSANPLILFDLSISLEWDATQDPTYLNQLDFDLKKTSQYLYDFTDGQAALGQVTVSQNADGWAFAHIDVHATNRLRPYATIGGLVITDTADLVHTETISYTMGQIHMGSVWNRYGEPFPNPGLDWPLILAHELGHYLLFLDDTYLGLDRPAGFSDEVLVALDECTGSAMGDVYVPDNTEFVTSETHWQANCAKTLTEIELGRTEGETISLWYPPLSISETPHPETSLLPFSLTQIDILPPITPTAVLADPTFFLDYQNNQVSSSEARTYLYRNQPDTPADNAEAYEYVYDLGSPVGGQNRVLARGAQPGDRLCVYDRPRNQYGCEVITAGDERIQLEQDVAWNPIIQISPVNSTTFVINVEAIPAGLPAVEARIFPEFGEAFPPTHLLPTEHGYQGTLQTTYPVLEGDVQLWVVETAEEMNPRRETMVAYSIGGNPGNARAGGGGNARAGGGGNARAGGGGNARAGGGGLVHRGHAPLVSNDGQMFFVATGDLQFNEGAFYTVQTMAGLPPLPTGKTAVGAGYNLFATPNAPNLVGSISFQYRGNDVLLENLPESALAIHYWNGHYWQTLQTYRDTYYNLASARSQGAGIYALLGGNTQPHIDTLSPAMATNDVTMTLAITGHGFLEPLSVALVTSNQRYTLSHRLIDTGLISATVPAGLPAQEYRLIVTNQNQPSGALASPEIIRFALFNPDSACFYDFFESGSSQWQLSADWNLVTIEPSGQQAITDSPLGPYKNAGDYGVGLMQYSTAITSTPFMIDSRCLDPILRFSHAYIFADSGDQGHVEISNNSGLTWQALARFSGPNSQMTTQKNRSPEWANVPLETVTVDVSPYAGQTVQLRLRLVVDGAGSDRGWVLDDLRVSSRSGTPLLDKGMYLPVVEKR